MSNLIRVLAIGPISEKKLASIKLNGPETETHEFMFHSVMSDSNLLGVISYFDPHVILTLTNPDEFKELNAAPLKVRSRWISLHSSTPGAQLAENIMTVFLNACASWKSRYPHDPLVSVFTPTFNTSPFKLSRAFESLRRQTYLNWEWVIFDDSNDNGLTWKQLERFSEFDYRVRIFRSNRNCGIIGRVKHQAAKLCTGSILVELDHDDALMPSCIEHVVNALGTYPDAGFAYSNFCERNEDGTMRRYGDGWGWGFGSYRDETVDGTRYAVAVAPEINCKTIRHITSAPNHVRAWRADTYYRIGGHSPEIHVCDDYELMVRTFLTTRMVHVDHFGYIQHFDGANTQTIRKGEIQKLRRYFCNYHNAAIHKRFLELNVPDSVWTSDGGFNFARPFVPGKANYVFKPKGSV